MVSEGLCKAVSARVCTARCAVGAEDGFWGLLLASHLAEGVSPVPVAARCVPRHTWPEGLQLALASPARGVLREEPMPPHLTFYWVPRADLRVGLRRQVLLAAEPQSSGPEGFFTLNDVS